MDIEQLNRQIVVYKNDDTLTDEIRNIRINIINTAIQRINNYSLYSQSLYQYLQNSGELVNLTEELYQIEDTLELNRISLKGMILESNLCKFLDNSGISYTLPELRSYLYQQYSNDNLDIEVIDKEITLYETIEDLVNFENNQIDGLAHVISNILKEKSYLNRKQDLKLLKENKIKIEMKIDKMYETKVLDAVTKDLLLNMINQIFNNYMNIQAKLPLDILE